MTTATVILQSNFIDQFSRKTVSNAGKSILEGLVVPAAPIFSLRSIENKGIDIK